MRHIYTVSAGRSGQASLAHFMAQHVPDALVLFEEPQVRPVLPSVLGDFERRFRRRFVETHEMLGRGKVLQAFDRGDDAYLMRVAERRMAWVEAKGARAGTTIHIDVGKFFVRGLHRATVRLRPDLRLIRLIRDPILNMRSYLNRHKNFYLDNNAPDGPNNQLRLDPSRLSLGELYLWAWCEVYLRGAALVDEFDLLPPVEIGTDDLNDAGAMQEHLRELGLAHRELSLGPARNTNTQNGYQATMVRPEDIDAFERFRDGLPPNILDRIDYLRGYDPRRRHALANAA